MFYLESVRRENARKWGVEELSKRLGVSKPTYYAFERDPGRMSVKQAEVLADYFGCSVGDLLREVPDTEGD